MTVAKLLISLVYLHHATAQDGFFPSFESPFGDVKLTAERGGPPPGAEFAPIKTINVPDDKIAFAMRTSSRPIAGRPPPPPPLPPRPTRRPRPKPIAPQPLPIPLPVNQGIPERPMVGNVPERPTPVTIATPTTEVRPDLETVASTPSPPLTTTPNTADAAPAYYHRFIQNEDGSYYFDFAAPNSIKRLEQGFFKRDNFLEIPILVKSGAYSYISPEGVLFRIDYVADEKGYRAFTSDKNAAESFALIPANDQ